MLKKLENLIIKRKRRKENLAFFKYKNELTIFLIFIRIFNLTLKK